MFSNRHGQSNLIFFGRKQRLSTTTGWCAKKQHVLQENERIIELMLKLARIRYPYNQGSLGNIYKAEGRLHEVRNMLLMTAADIEESSYPAKDVNES